MLHAQRTGLGRRGYDISADGRHITRWEPSWWRSGGAFDLDGRHYQVRGHALGGRVELTGPAGELLASARRVGRRNWSVEAGERSYQFRRASIWRGDQQLLLGDRPVGSIRRTGFWGSSAAADLPGMPEPLQVFVFCAVLARWAAAAAAAASG
jgi:hypothetical protein